MNVAAIKNFKDLGKLMENASETQLQKWSIARINELEHRIQKLEHRMKLRLGDVQEVPQLTRIGRYEPLVTEIMSDGKIWSSYAIAEEIKQRWPNLPEVKMLALNHAMNNMVEVNKLEKLASNTYRKPKV